MALARVEGSTSTWPLARSARAGVPGRMETVDLGQPFGVVVDYAHTADSLGKVLRILRPLASGRVIAVFGSAGSAIRPSARPWVGPAPSWRMSPSSPTRTPPGGPTLINEAIAEGARAFGAAKARRCS